MTDITFNLQKIIETAFLVFMIFVIIYFATNIFALLRFGRSKTVGFIAFVLFGLALAGLYFQASHIISQF